MADDNTRYDLVVVGGTASGISLAISSQRSGLQVRIVEAGSDVAFPAMVGREQLDVGYGEPVTSVDLDGESLVVTTAKSTYRARAVGVTQRAEKPEWTPSIRFVEHERIHIDAIPDDVDDVDILVVGYTDNAVELTAKMAERGGRVVLAARNMDPKKLSPGADSEVRRLERERAATILYRGRPDEIEIVNGLPRAYFDDRHTPDLEFDHIVFASSRQMTDPASLGVTAEAAASGRVWFHGTKTESDIVPTAMGYRIGRALAEHCFPEVELTPEPTEIAARQKLPGAIDELREEHYNATITKFEPTHSDLWVLRVRPDGGETSHIPGQYASLGLGFWEDRIDEAVDTELDERWFKLIRRSYSISNRIFDDRGYLADDTSGEELEFYIVLVTPSEENIPALTPRLALKRPGDRLYMGPKVAGRYTLDAIDDPGSTVLLLSTGTGEAPHNGMVVELLRKGHYGPIVSSVCVRQWVDLGYEKKHRDLEARYPNYHYFPAPTREPEVPKRYIQDLIEANVFESEFGVTLDPSNTHVYLCGNPSMIGLPEEHDGEEKYPETKGVVEILEGRGFKLDRRKDPGNIHYEEYW